MSPLPRVPEITGERPRWLADDPVVGEPVCEAKFPANREINREFLKFRLFSAILAPNQRANSVSYNKIPYATEQGINSNKQGITFEEQGISNFISKRPSFTHLFCSCRTRSVLSLDLQMERTKWRTGIERGSVRVRRFGVRIMMRWKRGDLNQRHYCEVHGLPQKAFENWRQKFRAEPQPPERRLLYRRRPLSPPLSPPVSPALGA
jgi:hypothetical protein